MGDAQEVEGRGILPHGGASAQPQRGERSAIPPLHEVLAAMRVVTIPTRTRFRGIAVREAAVFDAPGGPSEFSPFPEYDDAEASAWLAAAIDFGWAPQPAQLRDRIEVNATVPAVAAEEVRGILARFPGCRTAKVKVAERGQTLADDIARVREVRAVMGPDAKVRIDANGGWTVDAAETALRAIAELDSDGALGRAAAPRSAGAGLDALDYAEQPCATVPELAELRERLRRRGVAVRIAADESVRKAADPLAVARAGAADVLVIKAQPLGGVSRALGIVEQAGLPVVVSSALDTSAGISMGLRLAAALPDGMLAGACGLGTVALLDGDVTARSLLPERGGIPVERPALDPALLERYAAPEERRQWWRERVARCYAVLTSSQPMGC